MNLQLINGRICTPTGWLENGSIYCKDGKIVEISEGTAQREGFMLLDAKKNIVGPGGIDLHVHGASGRDFQEATEEAFETAVQTHLMHGTTSIYPTVASSDAATMHRTAEICEQLMRKEDSPILGLHYEGPYFNPKKCGGQDGKVLRQAKPEEYQALLDEFKCIKRWDAAPEMEGNLELGKACRKAGVVAAIAHTTADYDDVCNAMESGYTLVTHFYNAMTSVHNSREFKHEGTIESVFLQDNLAVEVIADGIHVPPVVMRLIHKIKGPDRIALITDALAAACCDKPVGLSNVPIIIEDGVCKLADRSSLAGSIATMDRLVDTVINKCMISWADTFTMTAATPARIMGVYDRKGSLSVGKDADICIYTPSAELMHVIKAGKVVK